MTFCKLLTKFRKKKNLLFFSVFRDFLEEKDVFLEEERNLYFGGKITLNEKEMKVNEILMKYKHDELNKGIKNPGSFPPAMHFFKAKKLIQQSEVFKMLKKLPKGSVLHVHDSGVLSPDWVIKNVINREHLYGKLQGDTIKFLFTAKPVSDWITIPELRKKCGGEDKFYNMLKSKLTLFREKSEEINGDIDSTWSSFQSLFGFISPLINYKPVFREFYFAMLLDFHQDNINHIELRSVIPEVYELDGTKLPPEEVVGLLKNISDDFVTKYPDSMGMKFIYAPMREVDIETVGNYFKLYKSLKEKYPTFVVGFDLVGQEDQGKPLAEFLEILVSNSSETRYFFHAAETNWIGMTDNNLIDAVLLNPIRIGHGYGILKHPKVLERVKKRGIGIEVNPISNQVLKLVEDFRNHPAVFLFANDFPVVISCDDPGFWGAEGLSYDFYMAFMGMTSYDADLKVLKQLAINSITYSGLSKKDINKLLELWKRKWEEFVNFYAK